MRNENTKRLGAALAGRKMWLKLKKEYDIDNGVYVLLMPDDDNELNEQALLHIDDLVAYKKARGVVILTNQSRILNNVQTYSDKIIAVKEISEKEIDNLLSLYELYSFTERLLIVSLTKPFGSKLHNTLSVNGITKEDLVCLCIFVMRDWTPSEATNG